jgi:hypothetical protein
MKPGAYPILAKEAAIRAATLSALRKRVLATLKPPGS